ncbi:hypothetical protein Hanom_Chr01g00062521 [Helianthus anomalus]
MNPFMLQPETTYRKTPAKMKKNTAVATCSESLSKLEDILRHGRENKHHTVSPLSIISTVSPEVIIVHT